MSECSLMKNVPIARLAEVRAQYKVDGVKIRIRYRGPRYDALRMTCLKSDATSFAVYPR